MDGQTAMPAWQMEYWWAMERFGDSAGGIDKKHLITVQEVIYLLLFYPIRIIDHKIFPAAFCFPFCFGTFILQRRCHLKLVANCYRQCV